MSELVVVMLVLSIVVIASATLTIGLGRTNAQAVVRQDQIDGARYAMDRMSRNLRAAVRPDQLSTTCTTCASEVFVSGQEFSMQFYANLESPYGVAVPSLVTYTVAATGPDAGVLLERVQVPDQAVPSGAGWTYCTATAPTATAACRSRLRTTPLARGVRATGTPLFSYRGANDVTFSAGGAGLSASEFGNVIAVEVQLSTTSTGAAAVTPTTVVQRVLLTNQYSLLRPNPGATP